MVQNSVILQTYCKTTHLPLPCSLLKLPWSQLLTISSISPLVTSFSINFKCVSQICLPQAFP